jgi:hypothetical protein
MLAAAAFAVVLAIVVFWIFLPSSHDGQSILDHINRSGS